MKINCANYPQYSYFTKEKQSNPLIYSAQKPLKKDTFIRTQSFGKKDIDFSTSDNLKTKLKEVCHGWYNERYILEYSSAPTTPQERKLVFDYINNPENLAKKQSPTDIIEKLLEEIDSFHKLNNRPMNDKEIAVFKEFIPEIEKRIESSTLKYKGNKVCELIPLALESDKKKDDIKKLFGSQFCLGEAYFSTIGIDEEPEIPEQDIIRLIKYKEQNPEIAQYIIPYATKNGGKEQTFSDTKTFFEYAKSKNSPELLLKLGEISAPAKEIIKLYELAKDSPEFLDIAGDKLKTDKVQFLQYITSAVKKYPVLKESIKKDMQIPEFYTAFKPRGFFDKLRKKHLTAKVKKLTDNNPNIDKLNNILPKDLIIDWTALIPDDCTKEKANDIINRIYKAYSFAQRLESENYGINSDPWSVKCKIISDCTTEQIKNNNNFETVLYNIGKGYEGLPGKKGGGTARDNTSLITIFNQHDYGEYFDRLMKFLNQKRKSPFSDMELTQIGYGSTGYGIGTTMLHPDAKFIPNAIKHATNEYNKFLPYVNKIQNGETLTDNDKKDATLHIATIHYIITNSLPFMRGTAGIANILTRSLYKSIGITLPPAKNNVALDLEAFCNTIDEYKEKWNSFFEQC